MPMPKSKIKWCKRSSRERRKFREMSSLCEEELIQGQEQKTFRLLLSSYGFASPIMREKYAKVIMQGDILSKKQCLIVPYTKVDAKKLLKEKNEGL